MATFVLSASSLVSCDEDENNNDEIFESKTLLVELPIQMGTGYGWVWTNKAVAAADSVSMVPNKKKTM